ncbi:hypothetical protein ACVME8_002006 [Bradyrhizobium diazoefficiens]|uniref:S1 family peptidase n=1 Tax=Bradyrhizobium diazoefficiens TaxID=1355477 RepID=UPI00272AAACB|nr:serine protease [Bradyrhizobium diazoefficiens]WLA64696.1 serine protease [Bradyrhizobium diazoefficiens]
MSVARLAPCILSVQALLALPVIDVRACESMSGNCGYTTQTADQNENKKKKVTDDPRKPLRDIASELGWSNATVARLRRITGFVVCQSEGKMRPFASGAIVGTDLTLLTAVHLFFDRSGRLKSLNCQFQNQASPVERVPLRLSKIEDARFGTTNPYDDWNHDWMVIRLARALPGIEPLRVSSDAVLAEGREVISVSAFQIDVDWVSRSEPIAEICTHWRLKPKRDAPPLMETDCLSNKGASGSPLITESAGQLVAVGVESYGVDTTGRLGYSPRTGGVVAIDSTIVAAIEELSGKRALRASIADAPLFIRRR